MVAAMFLLICLLTQESKFQWSWDQCLKLSVSETINTYISNTLIAYSNNSKLQRKMFSYVLGIPLTVAENCLIWKFWHRAPGQHSPKYTKL